MLLGRTENGKRTVASGLVALFLLSLIGVMVPAAPMLAPVQVLADEPTVASVSVPEQTYELYLDAPTSETGGQGSITTIEPNGGQEEGSAVSGLEFRSAEMISDLYINGTGASNTARLSVYIKFTGDDQATADVTFSLKSGDTQISSVSRQLDDACSPNFLTNGGCDWSIIEVEFDAGSNGFMVAKGKQLKIRIDAQVSCTGGTGGVGGGGGDCAVDIAFGKMQGSGGYSRLQIMTNALSGSSVRVHSCNAAYGCNWNDAQKFEWSPNHRPDFREMQFSVEVRDAFGRDDIEDVNLIMDTPNGANVVFEKNFEDDDFKLDNNGLVGNFTYTYDADIAAGDYPIRLEVDDVQGHSVVFEHPGITMLENDVYLTLPTNQPDVVLFAPGAVVRLTFWLNTRVHRPAASMLSSIWRPTSPSSWSDPQWSAPSNTYTLTGGGDSVLPELIIEAKRGFGQCAGLPRDEAAPTLKTNRGRIKRLPFGRFPLNLRKLIPLQHPASLSMKTMSTKSKLRIPPGQRRTMKRFPITSTRMKSVISTSMSSISASKRTRSKCEFLNNPTIGNTDFTTTIRDLNSQRKASTH